MLRILGVILAVVAYFSTLGLYAWIHYPGAHDGRIHIRYMSWGNPEQQATDEKVLREFERLNPTIKVNAMLIPGGPYQQKLQIMLESRTEPDVFRMDLYALPKYFQYGSFEPLNPFIERDTKDGTFDLNDFFEQPIEEVTYKGKIYGMNVVYGGKVIYYNKNKFRAAGLPDPYDQFKKGEWTMEAFTAAAQALTLPEERHPGVMKQYGVRLDSNDLWWITWAHGGDILSPDEKVRITEPKSLDGLRFFYYLQRQAMRKNPTDPNEPARGVMPLPGEGIQGSYTFDGGTLGMTSGFAGESPRYRRTADFEWDVVPVPSGPAGRHSLVKGNGLLMSKWSPHKDAAWKLIKFMVSPYAEEQYCGDKLRRATPTRKSVMKSEGYRKATRAPFNVDSFNELYRTAHRLPVTARWSQWNSHISKWLDEMNRGKIGPDEAAEKIKEAVETKFRELDLKDAMIKESMRGANGEGEVESPGSASTQGVGGER